MKKSIYYFDQAIELDSMYALAYAGLADAYYFMSNWGFYPKNDGFTKAKEFAQKSLSLNNNTAEAHATLGKILAFREWKWKTAEKEIKLAISLNHNSVTAHQYYYELLEVFGKIIEAREQINMAIELSPYDSAIRNLSAGCYFRSSNYANAIEESKKGLDLANESVLIFHLRLKIILSYLNLGRGQEAIENIKMLITTDPLIENNEFLNKMYQESGINTVLYWFVDWILINKQGAYNRNVAKVYALIGDSQNALKYLEKGYEIKESGLHFIIYYPNFDFIKTEPRFIALLEKMNLAD
ncbi:MAG: hypothetical protein QNK20_04990 [Aureibaculum sp.]|nr:hypothetical protein [Aureibaculum sp.]